jgi:hypothetical protein
MLVQPDPHERLNHHLQTSSSPNISLNPLHVLSLIPQPSRSALELRLSLRLGYHHRSRFALAQANIQELLLELDNHRHPSQNQPIL